MTAEPHPQYRCYNKELIDNILSHLWGLARSNKEEHRHKDAVDCALYVISQLENSVQVDTPAKSEQNTRQKLQCSDKCDLFGECDAVDKRACLRDTNREQEIREKVLKEVREKYVKYNDIPCPELAEKYGHACDSEYCGMCILDFVLEELREQGEWR